MKESISLLMLGMITAPITHMDFDDFSFSSYKEGMERERERDTGGGGIDSIFS